MQKIREERKLSRRDMASELGCTQTALWKMENGKVWPKKSTIDRFCAVCSIPAAYLYTLSFTAEDFMPGWNMPILKINENVVGLDSEQGAIIFKEKE